MKDPAPATIQDVAVMMGEKQQKQTSMLLQQKKILERNIDRLNKHRYDDGHRCDYRQRCESVSQSLKTALNELDQLEQVNVIKVVMDALRVYANKDHWFKDVIDSYSGECDIFSGGDDEPWKIAQTAIDELNELMK